MTIVLTFPQPVSDDDLIRFSDRNRRYRFERESDGSIRVTTTRTQEGAISGEALYQLAKYAKHHGGTTFDAGTGFAVGPGKTVRSPHAAWISREKLLSLEERTRTRFWQISPDVVIEICFQADEFEYYKARAREYMSRGTSYAVAFDPATDTAFEIGVAPQGFRLDFDAIRHA